MDHLSLTSEWVYDKSRKFHNSTRNPNTISYLIQQINQSIYYKGNKNPKQNLVNKINLIF